MSTEIKDAVKRGDFLRIEPDEGFGRVTIRVRDTTRTPAATADAVVRTADFLAAVETECGVRCVPADAIVIERAELPKVAEDRDGHPCVPGFPVQTLSAEKSRALALAHLALAEYLDAHPPVPPVSDEDVETLAGLLNKYDPDRDEWTRSDARSILTTRGLGHAARIARGESA